MCSQPKITLNIEIDEVLYNGIAEFINSNEDWDRDKIINTSLSLFLLQNSNSVSNQTYQASSKTYLHSVCSYFN